MSAEFAQRVTFGPGSPLYRPPAAFLRGCLGRFATGVAVVSCYEPGGTPHGTTVNSFTSVSMEPPLILVALQRTTQLHGLLHQRPFTVNILGAEQRSLALHFAGRPDPALAPAWVREPDAPRLAGVLGHIEAAPWAEYDGGDHTLFLGEIRRFDYRSGDALGFVNGQFTIIREVISGHEALL